MDEVIERAGTGEDIARARTGTRNSDKSVYGTRKWGLLRVYYGRLIRRHSITLSARTRSSGGIVTPRVRAVRRLTDSSKRAACSIGRSPGWAPFRILFT